MKWVAATVLAVLSIAACGDDEYIPPDAFIYDAWIRNDAAPDAGPPLVSFTLTENGVGTPGVTVYFQNADSFLVAEQTTDTTGTASTLMTAGGFVTVLLPASTGSGSGQTGLAQSDSLLTYAGVKPGDHLVSAGGAAATTQTIVVTAPTSATAVAYHIYTTCDLDTTGQTIGLGNTPTGMIYLPATCTLADVAVWAVGNSATQIAYANGISITPTLDLTTLTYAPSTSVAISYTDVPATASSVIASQSVLTARGQLAAPSGTVTLASAAGMTTLVEPQAVAARALTVTSPTYSASVIGQQQVLEISQLGTTYALDVGAALVHEITSAVTFDVPSHALTWTEASAGSSSDAVLAAVVVMRGTQQWFWQLASADTAGGAAFPVLPSDVFDYNVAATDTTQLEALTTFKVPGGYDSLRAMMLGALDLTATVPTAGKIVRQSYVAPGPD